MPLTDRAPTLLALLDHVDSQAPLARKRLLGPSVNYGREALVALLRRRGGVAVGWEATTLRRTAGELAFLALHEAGLRVADDVALTALTSAAFDAEIAAGSSAFGELAGSVGFRRAIHDAVMELRIAGVSAVQLASLSGLRAVTSGLAAVLARYETALAEARFADAATVFSLAIDQYDAEAPHVFGDCEHVVAALEDVAGLPGLLLERLLARTPTPHRWTAPALDPTMLAGVTVVRATVPEDEMLGLLRLAVAEGWRLDDIECAADARDEYGTALHAAADRARVPFTALHGLAFADSRLGRAMQGALTALTAPHLDLELVAAALERRELQLPAHGALDAPTQLEDAAALAAFVRRQRIGGTDARLAELRTSFGRAASDRAPERYEDEDEARFDARKAAFAADAARAVRLLDAVMALRAHAGCGAPTVASATVAEALSGWLQRLVPVLDDEQTARTRLMARLGALAATDAVAVPRAQALADVGAVLDAMRVWPTARRSPYASGGGAVHLTDLRHAGATARRVQWFAGLSADAVRGTGREAPLLDDRTRQRLHDAMGRPMPTSVDRLHRRRRQLEGAIAASVAREGRVIVSWSAGADAADAPDRLLLDVLRAAPGAESLEPADLLRHAVTVQAVPEAALRLDARDAWLHALLADGPADGTTALEAEHAGLGRWAAAQRAWSEPLEPLTPLHGMVPDAAARVPTRTGRSVSATELGTMLSCPRRWFLQHLLRLAEPTAPREADDWCDAAAYGTLVHQVYARAVHEQVDFASAGAGARLREMAVDAVTHAAERDPPASAAALAEVTQRLLADVGVFVQMEQQLSASGTVVRREAEQSLRAAGAEALQLDDGRSLAVHARVDRIDHRADGSVEVWDFKTSRAFQNTRDVARLTQALVGAHLVARRGVAVVATGFRFATERAEGAALVVPDDALASLHASVDQVLAVMEEGSFPPPPDPDQRACTYCGFQINCRAVRGAHATSSPPSGWAARRAPEVPDHDPVRRVAQAMGVLKSGAGAA